MDRAIEEIHIGRNLLGRSDHKRSKKCNLLGRSAHTDRALSMDRALPKKISGPTCLAGAFTSVHKSATCLAGALARNE